MWRSSGNALFVTVELGFAGWALALLAIGVRAVHGWSWPRAIGGVVLAVAIAALVVVGVHVL